MTQTVSLVLGSGGARGYAHIGVITELLLRNYQIIAVAGCSMGAVVGGLFAAGKLTEYQRWACSRSYFDVLRLVDLSLDGFGMIRGEKVFSMLREMVGDRLIEDLPIDFTAVATDLTYQKEVWFQQGDLLDAIRASIAIPSLFTPVQRNGHLLVDGGLLNPIPITPTVSAHADLIIAVNLNAPALTRLSDEWVGLSISDNAGKNMSVADATEQVEQDAARDLPDNPEKQQKRAAASLAKARKIGRLEMIYQSVEVMQACLTQYKIAGYPPDILIDIPKHACRFYEFHRAQEMIELGQAATAQVLDQHERQQAAMGWHDNNAG